MLETAEVHQRVVNVAVVRDRRRVGDRTSRIVGQREVVPTGGEGRPRDTLIIHAVFASRSDTALYCWLGRCANAKGNKRPIDAPGNRNAGAQAD